MKKIIILLALITAVSLSANPFNTMNLNKQNISQKVKYAKEAAAKGNAQAQFDLALMYAKGEGVSKSERLAFNWFHKAARNNHVEAKFYMGLSFAQGRGVKKQEQLARYWFKLAVKSGHRQAMAHLASIENKINTQYGKNTRVSLNTYR